jgi:hypothetical protein
MKSNGLVSINETTSVLGNEYLLEAKNVEADGYSIKNRNGIDKVTPLTYLVMGREPETKYMDPLAIKAVTIGSQEVILIVNHNGLVFGIIPEHYNQMYNLKYRDFRAEKHMDCRIGYNLTPPTRAEIIEYSNYVYVITNQGSWAIIKNGIFSISQSESLDDSIVVDALNATLNDLDGEFPKLELISKNKFSQLEAGERIFVRNVSQLGGRGYPSETVETNEQGSYFVHGIDAIPRITNSFINGLTCRKPIAKLIRTSAITQWATSGDPWSGYYKAAYSVVMNRIEVSRFIDLDSDYATPYPYKKMTLVTKNAAVDAFVGLLSKTEQPDKTFVVYLLISTYASASHTSTSTASYTFDNSYWCLRTGKDQINTTRTNYNCVTMVNKDGEGYLIVPNYDGIKTAITQGSILTAKTLAQYNEDIDNEVYRNIIAPNNCFEILVTGNWEYTGRSVNYTDEDLTTFSVRQGRSKIRHSAIYGTTLHNNRLTSDERIEWIPVFYSYSGPGLADLEKLSSDSTTVAIQTTNESLLFPIKIVGNKFSTSHNISSILYYRDKDNSYNLTAQFMDIPGLTINTAVFYIGWNGNTAPIGNYIDEAYLYAESATDDLFLYNGSNNQLIRYLPDDSQRFAVVEGLGSSRYGTKSLSYDTNTKQIGLKCSRLTDIAVANQINDVTLTIEAPITIDQYKLYEGYIENEDYDLLVARQDTNKAILSDVNISTNIYTNTFGLYTGQTAPNMPLAMTKKHVWASAQPKDYNRALGDFIKAVVFDGFICAYESNVIKFINDKLEWEVERTLEIPAAINNIESLGNSLYVFTNQGVYVILPDMSVDYLTSLVIEKACVANSQLVMVDSNGDLYKTEFTPMPVAQYNRQTKNPYIITKITSDLIHNITEGWQVKDLQYMNGLVYIITESAQMFIFDVDNNSFFEHSLPITASAKLVPGLGKMFLMGDMLSADEERLSPAVDPTVDPGG